MSTHHELIISNDSYAVPEGDIAGVERQIIQAVQAGGAFVELRIGLARSVSVLVTPATPVAIEHTELVFTDGDSMDALDIPRWFDDRA